MKYPVGGRVDALYDPNRPSYACSNHALSLHFLEIVSFIIGGCFLLVAYELA